jgi:putative phosphoribosyl transferase
VHTRDQDGIRIIESQVEIPAEEAVSLAGDLAVPNMARSIVLILCNGHPSPLDEDVADALQRSGIATLRLDLLTTSERGTRRLEINTLIRRLLAATRWIAHQPALSPLILGYFGTNLSAAAALQAAAVNTTTVRAVVSYAGWTDEVGDALPQVRSPTLLIAGSEDLPTLNANRIAHQHLVVEKALEIVSQSKRVFTDPDTLKQTSGLAKEWFLKHLEIVPRTELNPDFSPGINFVRPAP